MLMVHSRFHTIHSALLEAKKEHFKYIRVSGYNIQNHKYIVPNCKICKMLEEAFAALHELQEEVYILEKKKD